MPEDFERTTEDPVPDTATQYMVRMRDGVRLATDVYLADNGVPPEAVLVRLPYDKNSRYWPPPGTRERHLYLTNLPAAATTSGLLTEHGSAGDEAAEWLYDPEDLAASSVPNSFAFLHEFPDESATAQRPDVLSFVSEPAASPVDLAGPVDLLVTVTSTAPSTYVFAKLLDEPPDGTVRMIVRGQGELTDVSGAARLGIEMGHTGYRLRPGHRFRLNITSSDFPEYMRHPGTDENPWLATETKPSTQRLITRAHAPASLRLTVLDRK
ncbi:MAG: CocE/NonD family hydrolase [Streptosporangiaceae bacterium]